MRWGRTLPLRKIHIVAAKTTRKFDARASSAAESGESRPFMRNKFLRSCWQTLVKQKLLDFARRFEWQDRSRAATGSCDLNWAPEKQTRYFIVWCVFCVNCDTSFRYKREKIRKAHFDIALQCCLRIKWLSPRVLFSHDNTICFFSCTPWNFGCSGLLDEMFWSRTVQNQSYISRIAHSPHCTKMEHGPSLKKILWSNRIPGLDVSALGSGYRSGAVFHPRHREGDSQLARVILIHRCTGNRFQLICAVSDSCDLMHVPCLWVWKPWKQQENEVCLCLQPAFWRTHMEHARETDAVRQEADRNRKIVDCDKHLKVSPDDRPCPAPWCLVSPAARRGSWRRCACLPRD